MLGGAGVRGRNEEGRGRGNDRELTWPWKAYGGGTSRPKRDGDAPGGRQPHETQNLKNGGRKKKKRRRGGLVSARPEGVRKKPSGDEKGKRGGTETEKKETTIGFAKSRRSGDMK